MNKQTKGLWNERCTW